MQERLTQVGVEHLPCEVVGAAVHQAHPDGAVQRGDIHHPLRLHALRRGTLLRSQREARQHDESRK